VPRIPASFNFAPRTSAALGKLALQALKEHHARLEGLSGEGALITIETERFRTRILPLAPD
jgi:hypothetical protein